ncbi:DUF7511 domain-containing protein [Halorubrum alkaliphilum]
MPTKGRRSVLRTESPPDSGDARGERQPTDETDWQCNTVVEQRDDQPDQCTIYSTASADPVATTWISASAGSYCSVEACR